MKKFAFALVCLCVSAFCFAAARDGSIITYNLEYFANGAPKEIEFYITDSSVEINRFDKLVLNAKKAFGSSKLHEDLSDDFSYRFRIDFYYGNGGKKSYYLKNGFDVYDCKNKVFLELESLTKGIYANFSTYAVEHFYKSDALKKNKLSGTKRACFYLDSRPFALEDDGEICDRGNILFFDCELKNAPKIVNQIRNATRIPNGFAIKEALLEGSYIMQIYSGDKIEKSYEIVNSKNVYDDSGNLRKAAVADELLVMAVEFMIASWL